MRQPCLDSFNWSLAQANRLAFGPDGKELHKDTFVEAGESAYYVGHFLYRSCSILISVSSRCHRWDMVGGVMIQLCAPPANGKAQQAHTGQQGHRTQIRIAHASGLLRIPFGLRYKSPFSSWQAKYTPWAELVKPVQQRYRT